MRSPNPTPSLAPSYDVTVYIVLDDFGRVGRAYRETDEQRTDLEAVIGDMLSGQYSNPVRVVAFNTAEGWSSDVSEDIALEVYKRAATKGNTLGESTQGFVQFHVGGKVAV